MFPKQIVGTETIICYMLADLWLIFEKQKNQTLANRQAWLCPIQGSSYLILERMQHELHLFSALFYISPA